MLLPINRIRIPDSPVYGRPKEKHVMRSRCFRKIVTVVSCLCLLTAVVHVMNGDQRIRQTLSKLHEGQSPKTSATESAPEAAKWPSKPPEEHDMSGNPISHGSEDMVARLPAIVRIPFEQAVQDVELQGWEDEWFSSGMYNASEWGRLPTPRMDFVYNWVNGSEESFTKLRRKYELLSPLNDVKGDWMSKHAVNRYRDWDELRFSFRSLDKYAKDFVNKIQLLVNSVAGSDGKTPAPQRPTWLKDDAAIRDDIDILSEEDFFEENARQCLPSFNSLTIETQIYNTPSSVDHMVALSDDMLLGAKHSAADFFSPLFGPMFGFKETFYNTKTMRESEVPTFGEKPHLFYTSWLLNHRFGERKRRVQAHFSHSVSRRVMREAMASFPSPALRGMCERFRGESLYQIYPWYTAFHYSIERFREALLWSFIVHKSDIDGDGYLDWTERKALLDALKPGRKAIGKEDASTPAKFADQRERMYYQLPLELQKAGLETPLSNVDILWTSLDGPETIRDAKCFDFHADRCLGEAFHSPVSDRAFRNPEYEASNVFVQLANKEPKCGDCLIKFLLSSALRGLEPMLPPKSKARDREVVVKALVKYQHTIIEPEAMFVMVKDAEQARTEVLERVIERKRKVSQWCFNDDVMTEDRDTVAKVRSVMKTVFNKLLPDKSRWER